MTAIEFGEKYMNEDTLDIFDDACEFFSHKIPDDFDEEYDVIEILLEVRGRQEDEKNFDNVLKFTDIIKNNQPELYLEIFEYYDDFLIDYYCFKQDREQVKIAFANFNEKPFQDPDVYRTLLNKIFYYQHTKIIEHTADYNYSKTGDPDKEIGDAAYDLAFIKMYTSMQALYESKAKKPDIPAFISEMNKFGFTFKDNYPKTIEASFLKPELDNEYIAILFKNNIETAFIFIRSYFLRYMLSKGIQFYISAKIIDRLSMYWDKTNGAVDTTDKAFKIKTESFIELIRSLSGNMFSPNEPETIATLWGSVYLYEFFYEKKYITLETFNHFLEATKILKGQIIAENLAELWRSNFVHTWPKPNCISATEFTQEHLIFKKSVDLEPEPFNDLRKEISEELSAIGELANYIEEGSKRISQPYMKLYDKIFDADSPKSEFINNNEGMPIVRDEKKTGRNDPCTCGSGKKYKKCCG